jgi:hypothetical protein
VSRGAAPSAPIVQAPAAVVVPDAPPEESARTPNASSVRSLERAARGPVGELSRTIELPRAERPPQRVGDAPAGDAEVSAGAEPGVVRHSTACGGVFFLLNLGLRLGLYGDFTTPAQPGLALPIWDFVSMVGRRLAGPGMAADPIWRLLADLAGRRSAEPPGAGFDPPRDWRIPVEWLRPFSDRRACQWSVSSNRLRVRHPAGFLIIDVPRSKESARRQLTREFAPYRAAWQLRPERRHQHAGAARSRSPLTVWTAWLLPYVRARLRAAMAGRVPRAPGPLLCRQPARTLITPAHLHVTFALEALPIQVRLSGLDRDPGWIPAAGRAVTFAFE